MKNAHLNYAKAFAAVADGKLSAEKESELVRNLLNIVERRGHRRLLPQIAAAAEKILREKEGRRKVTLESARPIQDLQQTLGDFLQKDDIIEKKVDPAIVAGVKITIDDSRQYDGSLARKLNAVFEGQ